MYTRLIAYLVFFFFNDTATTEIYTLSLHTLFRSLHPRGIDAEFIAGSAIMIRIQEQPDHVGGREVVAPGEHRDDAVGVRIEGADENVRSEEHTSELQSRLHLVCRLLLEKKKKTRNT